MKFNNLVSVPEYSAIVLDDHDTSLFIKIKYLSVKINPAAFQVSLKNNLFFFKKPSLNV